MTVRLALRPRDGMSIKDPRGIQLSGGAPARALQWPLPPTLAGAARTALGTGRGYLERDDRAAWLALRDEVSVLGPLAVTHAAGAMAWRSLWPAPRDAVASPQDERSLALRWMCPRPAEAGAAHVKGAWGREAETIDALWWVQISDAGKPARIPSWWSSEDFVAWLKNPRESVSLSLGAAPALETRTDVHLALSPETGTAKPHMLYGLETVETLLANGDEVGVYARVRVGPAGAEETAADVAALTTTWRFGGEARLADAEAIADQADPFSWPANLVWPASRRFRLVLVTPAAFTTGFRPPWLSVNRAADGKSLLQGTIPGTDVRVTLRAALVDRAIPVSGWDFADRQPKPSRLLVPAGSIYFFEADRDVRSEYLQSLWLRSIQQENSAEARDGYGVVVPGAWPDP